jgi:hypothetical protein
MGRISRQDEKRGVAFGQHRECGIGVVLKRRADAGRIDEHGAFCKHWCRVEKLDAFDTEMIPGVGLFGNELKQKISDLVRIVSPNTFRGPTVLEVDADERFPAPGNESRDSGQRDNASWQERGAEESIDESAFPTLELAQYG